MLRRCFDAFKGLIKGPMARKEPLDITCHGATPKCVYVRIVESEHRIEGKFLYELPSSVNGQPGRERLFNFNRLKREPSGDALMRLQCNLWQHSTKKSKRKKKKEMAIDDEEPTKESIALTLFDDSAHIVDRKLANEKAWVNGGILQINSTRYLIQVNSPCVLEVTLPKILFLGFPVMPYLSLEFAEAPECDYRWLRITESDSDSVVGSEMIYTPTNDDVGCRLKLVTVPKRDDKIGESVDVISSSAVVAAKDLDSLLDRHKHTTTNSKSGR